MKTIKNVIDINAPKEKVWEALWEDKNYRQWTTVFHEGSHAVSDWEEGSKILFLGPDGNGMYSVIDKKILYKQMTFKHLGEISNGVEQILQSWEGAKESYILSETDGITTLQVDLDTTEEYAQYFEDTFPKALEVVKSIAETQL